ncbi:FkbM family methyltransferase [Methylobacterium organophilum]|uniref:FkbM family methyltransferase n=1 Tax=Methylobacterium organophilum TaxID=410 RepID=UPI001F13DEE3|nr:FkbM family methyltransferase [Methylobacterium organophilum]UMY15561.1 FkbM family methyltransferase [Methylobacterium organophilum]
MHVGEEFDRAKHIIELALNPHAYISYSQFGEDLLIDILFHGKTDPGFYVDVGAHHPKRLSNTYLLYKKGWRGINIEGAPNLIKLFEIERPEDINIPAFVSDKSESVVFNRFNDTAVNTISAEKKAFYASRWDIVSSEQITTRPLRELLDEHMPSGRTIDLLSVDVEGVDLKVLQGNDWNRYRPRLVIVEAENLDLMRAADHPIVAFLGQQGYRLSEKLHVSAFFLRN